MAVRRSTRTRRAKTFFDPSVDTCFDLDDGTKIRARVRSRSPALQRSADITGIVTALGVPRLWQVATLVAGCAMALIVARYAPADAKVQLLDYLKTNSVPRWQYLLAVFAGVLLLIPSTPIETLGGVLYAKPEYDATALQPTCVAIIGQQTATCDVLELWILSSLAKLSANVFSVLIARHFARDFVERHVFPRYSILRAASDIAEEEPLKTTLLIRGSMVPLAVKNYGCGVLNVPYWCIALGSLVFGPLYGFQNFLMATEARRLGEDSVTAAGNGVGGGKSMETMMFGYLVQLMVVMAIVQRVQARIRQMATAPSLPRQQHSYAMANPTRKARAHTLRSDNGSGQ